MKKIIIISGIVVFLTAIVTFITLSNIQQKENMEQFKIEAKKAINAASFKIMQEYGVKSMDAPVAHGTIKELELKEYGNWTGKWFFAGSSRVINFVDLSDGTFKVTTSNIEDESKWEVKK